VVIVAAVEDLDEAVDGADAVVMSQALWMTRLRRLRGSARMRISRRGRIIIGRIRGGRRWLGVVFRGSRMEFRCFGDVMCSRQTRVDLRMHAQASEGSVDRLSGYFACLLDNWWWAKG
jgi:hypothetical protein